MASLSGHIPLLLIIHAAMAVFMTGLVWFVQIVHYPLMARVGRSEFVAYERSHAQRTTLVVAPAMLIELVSAVLLAFALDGTRAASGAILWLVWSGLALLALIWVSTFLVQVPIHARLSKGLSQPLVRLLVLTNWVRTLAWSARSVVALTLLSKNLS